MKPDTWTCSSCGADVADYLAVCAECGADRDANAAPHRTASPAQRLDTEADRVSRHNMAVGGCWLVGGAFATLLSYRAAAPGGAYVVATGAIGYGLIRFLVGFANHLR